MSSMNRRERDVGYLKSEEYRGHKIWFYQHPHYVEAKVSLNGMWYSLQADTKEEADKQRKHEINRIEYGSFVDLIQGRTNVRL